MISKITEALVAIVNTEDPAVAEAVGVNVPLYDSMDHTMKARSNSSAGDYGSLGSNRIEPKLPSRPRLKEARDDANLLLKLGEHREVRNHGFPGTLLPEKPQTVLAVRLLIAKKRSFDHRDICVQLSLCG